MVQDPLPPLDLGDCHNFGKRVRRSGDWIYKPRCIFWEWLMLSSHGLRQDLNRILDYSNSPMSCIPILDFKADSRFSSGFVQRVETDSVTSLTSDEMEKVGGVIGLCTWFGLSDLHQANVICGLDRTGSFLFSPIDIEILFEDLRYPSQTLLIPYAKSEDALPGANALLTRLSASDPEAILALCRGYLRAVQELSRKALDLYSTTEVKLGPFAPHIRRVLRSTKVYLSGMQSGLGMANHCIFFPEEIEQMSRGDVPYFFRFIDSQKLFYFYKEDVWREVGQDMYVFDQDLPGKPSLSQFYESRRDQNILLYGLGQILRLFTGTQAVCKYKNSMLISDRSSLFFKSELIQSNLVFRRQYECS